MVALDNVTCAVLCKATDDDEAQTRDVDAEKTMARDAALFVLRENQH